MASTVAARPAPCQCGHSVVEVTTYIDATEHRRRFLCVACGSPRIEQGPTATASRRECDTCGQAATHVWRDQICITKPGDTIESYVLGAALHCACEAHRPPKEAA